MLTFAYPWLALIAPLPLALWLLLPAHASNRTGLRVPFFDRLAALSGQSLQIGGVIAPRRTLPLLILILCWLLAVAALARPQRIEPPLQEGDDLANAVALAQRILTGNGHGGSILVMADTVVSDQLARLGETAAVATTILSLLPANLDAASTGEAARTLRGAVIAATADQEDVSSIARRLDRVGRTADVAGEGQQWQEAGYWLTPLFALLALLWFRRGWVLT